MDDIEIIPSELIFSGNARRLRSVDAKLQEEMKTLAPPPPPTPTPPASRAPPTPSRPQTPAPTTPKPPSLQLGQGSAQPRSRVRPTFVGPLPTLRTAQKGPKAPEDAPKGKIATTLKIVVPLPPRRADGRFVKALPTFKVPSTAKTPQRVVSPPPQKKAEPSPVMQTPLKINTRPGDWVWGKRTVDGVETWYPALVVDPKSSDAPLAILQDSKQRQAEGKVLLSFIERGGKRHWAWILAKALLAFGHRRSAVRRIKKLSQHTKDLVMDAYEEALKHSAPQHSGYGDDSEDGEGSGDDGV